MKSYDKIIFLGYQPLSDAIVGKFYFRELMSIGIEVEYWDMTAVFFGVRSRNSPFISNFDRILVFHSYKEISKALKIIRSPEKVLLLSIMTFEVRIARLLFLLSWFKCDLAVYAKNSMPRYIDDGNIFIIKALKKLAKKRFYLNLMYRFGILKNYDLIFQAGSKGWRGIGQLDYQMVRKSNRVEVNSDDYDGLLKHHDIQVSQRNIAVFLDVCLPFHPDLKLFGYGQINPSYYYSKLNEYFDDIESMLGIKVVIAAHPKSVIKNDRKWFNGREIYQNETLQLIRSAVCVISHHSTSVSWAVLLERPIKFITMDMIEEVIPLVHHDTVQFSRELGCCCSYIDRGERDYSLFVDKAKFRSFKYEYFTSPLTESTPSEFIIQDLFKNGI